MKILNRPSSLMLAAGMVAVAGAFTLGTAQAQPMPTGWRHHGGPGIDGPAGPAGAHLAERMLDRVKATPEQRTQIRQIMESARKDLQTRRESGRGLREQQLQLLAQPQIDAQAMETLRQKQLAQHDQASKRMQQALVDAAKVLTPEQRAQIAADMKQRRDLMERHQRERRALDKPSS